MFRKDGSQRLAGLSKIVCTVSELRNRTTTTTMCLLSLGLSFALLAAYISRSQESTIEPYLITVDSHGVVLDRGRVTDKITSGVDVPVGVIDSMMSDFIRDLRTVSVDKRLQAHLINKVYAFIKHGSVVHTKINTFYTSTNPMSTAMRGRNVQVEIANLMHLDDHTIQIDWNEIETTKADVKPKMHKKRALISYDFASANDKSASVFLDNPLRLFISELLISDVYV